MNMKKIVSGVIAGILAVGCMSMNVSADQDNIKLVYDLKSYEATAETGTVTITSKYIETTDPATYGFNADTPLIFGAKQKNLVGMHITSATIEVESIQKVTNNKIGTKLTWAKNTVIDNYVNNDGTMCGDVVFGDVDNDGYEEFIVPTALGAQTGKFNIQPYSLATLGYCGKYEYGFTEVTVNITYEIPAEVVTYPHGWAYKTITKGEDITVGLECGDKAFDAKPSGYAVTAISSGFTSDRVYPFKTTLNPKKGENNVIAALKTRKAGGNYYTNPVAVINDAIANHEDVLFTFKSYDGYVVTPRSTVYNHNLKVGQGLIAEATPADWHNPTFGQHLYTNIDGSYSLYGTTVYDTFGSYSSAWGINLFTGAVVVNSGLTMQLNDVDAFEWGDNTLTFNWFDIIDEGKITDAKTFLTSMLLYTPVDWYWDSLTIEVLDTIVEEDIGCGAGLESNASLEEILAPIDEEIEDGVVDDTPLAEVIIEVKSPTTGNAPIGCAVIPVALAAMAIVLRKKEI